LKDLCDVDSDPLMQEISNSLSVEAVRLLAANIMNRRHKPKGRRWNFEGKILALSLLKHSPSPMFFFRSYSLFHQDAPFNPSSILFILGPASITMFLMYFVTLCRKCLKKTCIVVSCVIKC